jgi:ABC-type multidrug transport system ATPase subunit/pSer/pThr/pTyr-binding forkhead associated (FHA) protein
MNPKIGFLYEQKIIKKVRIEKGIGGIMVGRSSKCDIQLSLSNISSFHVQLIMNDFGEIFLIDQNSTNGTYINGHRINPGEPTKITEKDIINLAKIDEVKIVFNPDSYDTYPLSEKYDQSHEDTKASTNLLSKLKDKSIVYIGRDASSDIVLNHPNVSRQHAMIEKRPDGVFIIKDMGSTNGTYLNGKKINTSTPFSENDTILIGRFKLSLSGATKDLSKEIAIRAEHIKKVFNNGKVGLHELSLDVPSNVLLAVMGPSGCGKSTLLKALNGAAPPTSGSVFVCGLELNQNYDFLKTQIGYVPQDDIVHRELTVEQSLWYSAKLRLQNLTEEQINNKIDQVLNNLKINHIRHQLVGVISGGQRKRVSIAVEVLNEPLILFLDEPTSPLDPETIEDFLGSLRKMCDLGTTVVIVTHKPEDLNYVDTVVFMAEGGHMAYSGSSKSYLNYFEVTDVVKVYSNLAGDKSKKWIDRFNRNKTTDPKDNRNSKPIQQTPKTNYFLQYWWLTMRYFNIKFNDKLNSLIMIGQAPFIAILVCLIYDHVELSVPFFMTVSAVWLGTNNAAREIVAELPIYLRERMFNQGIFPYLFSKITVLGLFSAIQSFLFTSIISLRFLNDSNLEWNDPVATFLWMLILSITSTLMGLLLSAIFNTTEKVITLVPLALIPQIILAGVIAKINNGFVESISYLTISRWGTEGFCNIQDKIILTAMSNDTTQKVNAVETLNNNFHQSYKDTFGAWHGSLRLDLMMISILTLMLFIAIVVVLKKKDTIKINQ